MSSKKFKSTKYSDTSSQSSETETEPTKIPSKKKNNSTKSVTDKKPNSATKKKKTDTEKSDQSDSSIETQLDNMDLEEKLKIRIVETRLLRETIKKLEAQRVLIKKELKCIVQEFDIIKHETYYYVISFVKNNYNPDHYTKSAKLYDYTIICIKELFIDDGHAIHSNIYPDMNEIIAFPYDSSKVDLWQLMKQELKTSHKNKIKLCGCNFNLLGDYTEANFISDIKKICSYFVGHIIV